MAATIKPFADDTSAVQIGELTIENGTERITISGQLDLARDHQALTHIKALRTALEAIAKALEGEQSLPAKSPPPAAAKTSTAKNPFA